MEDHAGGRPPPVRTGGGTEDMFDADAFFQAISNDQEAAMAMIRIQVPSVGAPSPQAQAFVNSGEWDTFYYRTWRSKILHYYGTGRAVNSTLIRYW